MTRISLGVLASLLVVGASNAHATLLHHYDLTASFHDQFGGPDITPDGGTLTPGTGYVFGPNQGLLLDNALGAGGSFAGDYTIELVFKFTSSPSGTYAKIIDPKNATIDEGLYDHSGALDYARNPGGDNQGPTGVIALDTFVDVTLTRHDAVLSGTVGGVQQFSVADPDMQGVFDTSNNRIIFFEDDIHFQRSEAASGTVTDIKIFNNQVSTAPEPGSFALLGLTGGCLLAYARLRKRP
jgi:hypothetical protein